MAKMTKGYVYAVKKSVEQDGVVWCKVSWCHMSRTSGQGSRWKLTTVYGERKKMRRGRKRKSLVGTVVEVKSVTGQPVCTWVKYKKLPLAVKSSLKEGVVSGGQLRPLRQIDRVLLVDAHAHPLTMKTKLKSVSKFFKVASNKIVFGICTEDFDGKIELAKPGGRADSPRNPKKRSRKSGLRLCPHTKLLHDLEWFVETYGDEEDRRLWDEAK